MPRSRSSVDLASYTERAGAAEASTAAGREGTHDSGQDRELTKLNQIIQVGQGQQRSMTVQH